MLIKKLEHSILLTIEPQDTKTDLAPPCGRKPARGTHESCGSPVCSDAAFSCGALQGESAGDGEGQGQIGRGSLLVACESAFRIMRNFTSRTLEHTHIKWGRQEQVDTTSWGCDNSLSSMEIASSPPWGRWGLSEDGCKICGFGHTQSSEREMIAENSDRGNKRRGRQKRKEISRGGV